MASGSGEIPAPDTSLRPGDLGPRGEGPLGRARGGALASRGDGDSHGPDVDFGAVLLPGQQLGRGVGGAAALRAERVRVAQDARTVAQAEVCEGWTDGSGSGNWA